MLCSTFLLSQASVSQAIAFEALLEADGNGQSGMSFVQSKTVDPYELVLLPLWFLLSSRVLASQAFLIGYSAGT